MSEGKDWIRLAYGEDEAAILELLRKEHKVMKNLIDPLFHIVEQDPEEIRQEYLADKDLYGEHLVLLSLIGALLVLMSIVGDYEDACGYFHDLMENHEREIARLLNLN